MRTKARYADAIRALNNGARDAGPPELTPTELLAVTTIAYLQPATRAELSRLVGKEVSRDVIGRLKSLTSSGSSSLSVELIAKVAPSVQGKHAKENQTDLRSWN